MSKTNYTKFSVKKPEVKPVEEPVVETFPEVSESTEEPLYGKVHGCAKLNVRKAPDAEADVLCVIDSEAEVVIVKSESTEEFYKVFTAAGVEGFCMKKFVTLVP